MKFISIDIESYSSLDLQKCGLYKYAQSPDFEILLFAYSADGGDVTVIDLANSEEIPNEIISAIKDENVLKGAFNANFERVCLSRHLGINLSPKSWRCTMVWAAYMGLPLSLENAGAALGLEKQKLSEGKDLIRYFCTPCKPTTSNGNRTRNLPKHALQKWEMFKEYNRRDVEVEMAIQKKLSNFPVPDFIWDEYNLDQKINDCGVAIDMALVKSALKADEKCQIELVELMRKLTNIDNPKSVAQMKEWLSDNGLETDSLGKKIVADLLKTAPQPLGRVLELRQQLAKSSVKKYQAMQNCVCADGRVRGLFQFYGANRSGRWSGRNLQPQNLPVNHLPDLEQARDLVKSNNFKALEMLYDSVPEVLSELIRTAFVPKKGCKFIVADFSSIERVVLAWLAGEQWVLDAYSKKTDLYSATASQMFKVPIEQIDKKSPLRQKGKVADLSCGYGGSVGALKAMGALDMGLLEEELKPLVTAWRNANPNIVEFWWAVDRSVIKAVREKTTTDTHGITFSYKSGMLFITLPSGRMLSYVKPCTDKNQFGSDCVTYYGVGATKKWERIESYGPKFVENIVQAISRDLLSFAMKNLQQYSIVMHIHDEIVIEADHNTTLESICNQMSRIPVWGKGLILRADGYECSFYKKD